MKREFDRLNELHWGGTLELIEIVGSRTLEFLGEYICPVHEDEDFIETYRIVINLNQSRRDQRSTLLHEMCHHAVFLANKQKHYDEAWSWHGRAWKAEMKRVGFEGAITEYT